MWYSSSQSGLCIRAAQLELGPAHLGVEGAPLDALELPPDVLRLAGGDGGAERLDVDGAAAEEVVLGAAILVPQLDPDRVE